MVNLETEIENENKWNEKKLGPCMSVFINFAPHTTLDLFHPKILNQYKEIEISKVASRLWNGKMIKKWPMLKANSVLQAPAVTCAVKQKLGRHTSHSQMQLPAKSSLGSLRFDDGNVNDNATNQWFDWLNEEE